MMYALRIVEPMFGNTTYILARESLICTVVGYIYLQYRISSHKVGMFFFFNVHKYI